MGRELAREIRGSASALNSFKQQRILRHCLKHLKVVTSRKKAQKGGMLQMKFFVGFIVF